MPVTFGGMASGLNTDDIIKKLVEVEARPIYQWQDEIATSNRKKDALGTLKNHLNNINAAAKDLYGFRSSFGEKKAVPSDSKVFTATAGKNAVPGEHTIEVIQLATTHKVSTDTMQEDARIEPGKFTLEVNGVKRSVAFRGGGIKSFYDQVEAAINDIAYVTLVNTKGRAFLVTIESKTPGARGELVFDGDRNFLLATGLIKGEKKGERDTVAVVFDGRYFVAYGGQPPRTDTGSLDVDRDGKRLSVKGALWREYLLPMEIPVKKTTMLEFDVEHVPVLVEREEVVPDSLEAGPDEKTVIKGIELRGYNVTRKRPQDKKPVIEMVDLLGVGVVAGANGRREEKIYPVQKDFKGRMELPIGQDFENKPVSKIIFYCNEGTALFGQASVYTPKEGKSGLEAKNEIVKPEDARLKLDGVELQRDRNDGLTDVIKGVTLNLLSRSDKPVSIRTEADAGKGIDKIKKFIEVYNAYLDYNRELTKAEKSEKPGEFDKARPKSGLFVGDMMILRLENSLKETVSGAYPGRGERPVKLFTQMGVSTGAFNAPWETIRMGKLVVDEGVLTSAISDNPDGVEEFFGSDTDGDNRVDNGMAFRIETILKPYVTSGKNIITAKIELEDTSIKSNNDRISRHQVHLKNYEEKLRKKFASMEQSISGSKAQGDWFKNQMKGMEGGNEK